VQFTLKMCTAAKNKKRHSKSFKVTNADTIQKLVTSARYDKQHVCAYLQLFSH